MWNLDTQPTDESSEESSGVTLPRQILLGARTGATIDAEDFSGNNTLINLCNSAVLKNIEGRTVIARQPTKLEDIIRTVLRVSHRDLVHNAEFLADDLLEEFIDKAVDLSEPEIATTIKQSFPTIADTDLMRGMQAFSDAEYDQHQGIYEMTLVRPATMLAGWLILTESRRL